jgi:hypothetical protein
MIDILCQHQTCILLLQSNCSNRHGAEHRSPPFTESPRQQAEHTSFNKNTMLLQPAVRSTAVLSATVDSAVLRSAAAPLIGRLRHAGPPDHTSTHMNASARTSPSSTALHCTRKAKLMQRNSPLVLLFCVNQLLARWLATKPNAPAATPKHAQQEPILTTRPFSSHPLT